MESIGVTAIRTDGGTQPRAAIDDSIVQDYATALLDGDAFPPVVVFYDGTDHWLADGFHRVQAHIRAGRVMVKVDVRQGTRRDAVLFSVGANAAHGLRRTNPDKRRAVETLLHDAEWSGWSDAEIARRCAVSRDLVSRCRPSHADSASEPATRTFTTKHGTVATMNTGAIGKSKAAAPTAPEPATPAAPPPSAPKKSAPKLTIAPAPKTGPAIHVAIIDAVGALGGDAHTDASRAADDLRATLMAARARLDPSAHVYVFAGKWASELAWIVAEFCEVQDTPIVWMPARTKPRDGWYASAHQYVVFGRLRGSSRVVAEDADDVVQGHAREVIATFIQQSARPGEVVADPTGRSADVASVAASLGHVAQQGAA